MTHLYSWLMFFHVVGLVAFVMPHGVNAAVSFAVRGPATAPTRRLLTLSQQANFASYPGLLLLVVTGVWMGFAGSWWGQKWIWTAIVVLVLVAVAMGGLARAYYQAREAKDDAALGERLSRARPVAAAAIGGVGLLILIFLMVFKPF